MAGPGLLSSGERRSRACARVLSATPLVTVLLFFSASRANCVRNSGGARDNGTRLDTPARSPAPAVPLRGLSVSGARAGAGGERVNDWRGVGEGARPGAEGGRSLAGGGRAPSGPACQPRPPVAVGPRFPRARSLKGLGPRSPPRSRLPPPVLRDSGLPMVRV